VLPPLSFFNVVFPASFPTRPTKAREKKGGGKEKPLRGRGGGDRKNVHEGRNEDAFLHFSSYYLLHRGSEKRERGKKKGKRLFFYEGKE